MEWKNCPHCGARLPEEAFFCPHCAQNVHPRTKPRMPVFIPWRKILWFLLLPLTVLSLCLGWYWASRPKVYEDGGAATVIYTDQDGSYQLLLSWVNTPYTPAPEVYQKAEKDGEYHFPLCLFVHNTDSDANAANIFLNKVKHITAQFDSNEGESEYITCTAPAPHSYCPEAMAVSFINFLGRDTSAVWTWTITMNNGDVIRLHQTLKVQVIQTIDYYPEDAAMGTIEELQALIDQIGETENPSAVVNLHLPAVVYEGNLTISKRPVNLLGSTEGKGRTVFTGTLRIATSAEGHINQIDDIDFIGSGQEKIGVTAAARLHMTGCTFTGWKTAVLAHGYSWLNLRYCQFEDNKIGFHFNASESYVSHSQFTGNRFIRNGTAVLWEGTPVDMMISFPESVFDQNDVNIDNRRSQPMDLSEAIFQ